MVPGKEAFAAVNKAPQSSIGISLTPTAVIDAMRLEDIPESMKTLIGQLETFAWVAVPGD